MTTKPLRVLIVDDDTERSLGWKASIDSRLLAGAGADVSALPRDQSSKLIVDIDARRRLARSGANPFDTASPLDDVDVLVLDYDLEELEDEGTTSTGLLVAMLARAFSRTKLIVLVNQFGTNKFDLTMTAAVRSNADFDVNEAQLLNPTLWDRSRIEGFAPWAWEDGILAASARMDAAIDWVRSRLDEPVLQSLGLGVTPEAAASGSLIAKELWQECVDAPSRTFREMVGDARFLTPKDREAIQQFDESCSRVAATLVIHWLDRWVIPANEVLIDLPHLASADPWLLRGRNTHAGWQATVGAAGIDALVAGVQPHAFQHGLLLSRPAVWRQRVATDIALREPSGFKYDDFPDMVFCENTSKFVEFELAKPFSSRLPVSDPQRFVMDPGKAAAASTGFEVNHVAHEPQVLFAI
jgi:hypothetical protein